MRHVLILLALPLVLAAACGDSEAPPESTASAEAQATVDALRAQADELGVTEDALAYAEQFCDPIQSLADSFLELEPDFDAADEAEDFEVLMELMALVEEPLRNLSESLEDIDPPASYEEYHTSFEAQIDYALEAMQLIKQGGFFAALTLDEEPTPVEEPPELESALAIACGPELVQILDGGALNELTFFANDGDVDSEPDFTGPGSTRDNAVPLGTSVRVGDELEVRVTDVNLDAWPVVQSESELSDPPAPGNRMVLISLEISNIGTSDESTFVSDGSFSLTGSRNVVYNPYDDGVYCGFIPNQLSGEFFPGGTLRGNVCFQYPEDETNLVLIAEPTFSFGSSSRRYLALE